MITPPRVKFISVRQQYWQQIRSCKMENHTTTDKVYFHYDHTDSCKLSRWNARESYLFMYERPWQPVVDFYADVVKGLLPLSSLISNVNQVDCKDVGVVEPLVESEIVSGLKKDKTGRWARATYKIILSYSGTSFDGWQRQPGLNTVQCLVEKSLGRFVDEKKVEQLKKRGSPIEASVLVAGRTDKGVTALQQVCAFYTWRKDLCTQEIKDAINNAEPGSHRVVSVSEVSRAFHPNFSAKWRRYLYIFPLNDETFINNENNMEDTTKYAKTVSDDDDINSIIINDNDVNEDGKKPSSFSVSRVNQLLGHLEGKLLSYKMFARDTKAARNVGPPTECFIYHARATEARLPSPKKDDGESTKVMCVELVANRFLRRMVRVLVATAIREAAAGAEEDGLLKLIDATCRRATAPPAPPHGLCLVDVGYTDFDSQTCLIPY